MQRTTLPVLALGFVFLASTVFMRSDESLRADEPQLFRRWANQLSPLQDALAKMSKDDVLAGPREIKLAALYSRCALLYQDAHTLRSSLVSNREAITRHALNAYLSGYSWAELRLDVRGLSFNASGVEHPGFTAGELMHMRHECFREIEGAPDSYIGKFGVTHVLLPAGRKPRQATWRALSHTSEWTLWQIGGRN
jgi:hypothetical protein